MRNRKKEAFWDWIRFLVFAIIILGAIYWVLSFLGQRTIIIGDSMYPTLEDGDSVFVNKLEYKNNDIERFDVVVFPHYNEVMQKEVFYIKRVIGMPNDIIRISNAVIYINEEPLEEYYGYYDMDMPFYCGVAEEEIVLGENEYFVLGDNRNDSDDSRKFGPISRDIIIGRADYKIFPKSVIGKIL